MPANALAILPSQLQSTLRPIVNDYLPALLAGSGIPPAKLTQGLLYLYQKTDKAGKALRECSPATIAQCLVTAGNLQLEMDGTTGQFFILPFGDKHGGGYKRAQSVIGYKGFNTLGARGGYVITGDVVREGDAIFEFEKGTSAFLTHRRGSGKTAVAALDENWTSKRIVGAWAMAQRINEPPIIEVLGRDEIEDIKEKSMGAREADSPWRDMKVGFPAMATKSAKRRLARSIALGAFVRAATMEEAVDERGRPAYIDVQGRVVVDGERPVEVEVGKSTVAVDVVTQPPPEAPPEAQALDPAKPAGGAFPIARPKRATYYATTIEEWRARHLEAIAAVLAKNSPLDAYEKLKLWRDRNAEFFVDVALNHQPAVNEVGTAIAKAIEQTRSGVRR